MVWPVSANSRSALPADSARTAETRSKLRSDRQEKGDQPKSRGLLPRAEDCWCATRCRLGGITWVGVWLKSADCRSNLSTDPTRVAKTRLRLQSGRPEYGDQLESHKSLPRVQYCWLAKCRELSGLKWMLVWLKGTDGRSVVSVDTARVAKTRPRLQSDRPEDGDRLESRKLLPQAEDCWWTTCRELSGL